MEISGVSSKAYTSAAASLEEEDELKETQEENATDEAKEYGVSTKEAEVKDLNMMKMTWKKKLQII